MSLTQNPHDKFAHHAFTNVAITRELLELYLPQQLNKLLNLKTLRLTDSKFVSQHYSESRTDLLFEVETTTKELLLILVLFEHKSYFDKKTLLQILNDMVQKWLQELDHGASQLTPILPIIFYHGDKQWPYPTNLQKMFPRIEILSPYIPAFDAILQDFSREADHPIKGSHQLRSFLNAFRYVRSSEKIDLERFIRLLLADLIDWNQEILNYTVEIMYYLVEVTGKVTYKELVDVLENQGEQGDVVMRTLKMEMMEILRPKVEEEVTRDITDRVTQQVTQEVTQQVTQEVTQQVTQEVTQQTLITSIITVLQSRFGPIPSTVQRQIESKQEVGNLQETLSIASTANSLAEFISFIEKSD